MFISGFMEIHKLTTVIKKVRCMLLPSVIQQKGRDLQYGKWHVEP